jgi:uncharacterized protein
VFYPAFVGFVAVNCLAYFHARAMTTYVRSGNRTSAPEQLNLISKAKLLLTGVQFPRPQNHRDPKDFGLNFQTHRFPGSFGLELEAWSIVPESTKGMILMFHGNGASKESLLPAAKIFSELGWGCALVDFHGSGGSQGTRTSIGWHESIDVVATYDQFSGKNPGEPVILYGVSMGTAAILRAVHTDTIKPDGLILELPFDRLINAARQRFHAMGIPAWPLADLLILHGGWQQGFDGLAHAPCEYAKSVALPSLILNAEQDRRAPPAQAKAVFRALSGPKYRKQFATLGHESLCEGAHKEWRAAVAAFLAKIVIADALTPNLLPNGK